METALYHPEHGYYRRGRDPFGVAGDYYTAEQLQPVFGILVARAIRRLFEELGQPPEFTVVELGAGRREMEPSLSAFRYLPIEVGGGELPERITGVVFSNEFFDALPVDRIRWRDGALFEMLVDWNGERFTWREGERAGEPAQEYAARYLLPLEEGATVEVNFEALNWIEKIARALDHGFHFTIDYGYERREAVRFVEGTLMSYRRHVASEDVLATPGERDITAHVNFSALEDHGGQCGLRTVRLQTLAQTLFAAGEGDQFAEALSGGTPVEQIRRRLQLKTLLFGMGENFRTLLQRKEESGARRP